MSTTETVPVYLGDTTATQGPGPFILNGRIYAPVETTNSATTVPAYTTIEETPSQVEFGGQMPVNSSVVPPEVTQRLIVESSGNHHRGFARRHKGLVALGTAATLLAGGIAAHMLWGDKTYSAPKPPMTPSMALNHVEIDYAMPFLIADGQSTAVADGRKVSCLIPHEDFVCSPASLGEKTTVGHRAAGSIVVQAEKGSIDLAPGKDTAGEDVIIATVHAPKVSDPENPTKAAITFNTQNMTDTQVGSPNTGSLTSNDVEDAEGNEASKASKASFEEKCGEVLKDSVAPALAARIKQDVRTTAKGFTDTDAAKILTTRANRPIGLVFPKNFLVTSTAPSYRKQFSIETGWDDVKVNVSVSPKCTVSKEFVTELKVINDKNKKGFFVIEQ
jgi:hypothetical protein